MTDAYRFEIPWTKSLVIDNGWIDQQHQQMILHIVNLINAIAKGNSQTVINNYMTFLHQYANIHFNTEEQSMQKYHYPNYIPHRQEHLQFVEHLRELDTQLEQDGPSEKLGSSIGNFLWNWFKRHIQDSDRAYGEYLKVRGIIHPA
jgi:hemerythrin